MIKRLLVFVTIMSLLALTVAGCSEPVPVKKEGEESIKIGLILPMKGDFEKFGTFSKRGIELVVDDVNLNGGVLGHKLEIIPGDDASNPNVTGHIASEYTDIRKVSAIIGPFTTQSAIMAAPVANKGTTPLIAIRSEEASVTQVGEYIFRACYVDNYQGTLLGKFAAQDLKAKTAAVIYNSGDKDVKALIDNFRTRFEKDGGKVATVQAYDNQTSDFTSQLKAVSSVKPDVVLLTDYEDKSGAIMKKAVEMGIKTTYLGTDFWNIPKLAEVAGSAAEGSYYTAHFSAQDPSPKVKEFVELYQGDFVAEPEEAAALSYDAMSLVIEAMRQAESSEPTKIRRALAGISGFEGVTGTFSFNGDRNPVKGGIVMKVKNGKPEFTKRVAP